MAGEAAALVADTTPYVTAAVSAYGGAVLAKVRDDAASTTAEIGRRLLQRVFGHRKKGEPLPTALADLSANPADTDAAAVVRWAIKRRSRQTRRCLKTSGQCLRQPRREV